MDAIAASGELVASGTELNLRTQGCTFGSVQASITKGMLDFSMVTILNPVAGIQAFIASSGDIIVGPQNVGATNLTWSNPCGFVCLPEGRFVDDSECAVPSTCRYDNCSDASLTSITPGNSTEAAEHTCYDRVCAGSIVSILPQTTSTTTLSLSLSTLYGSLYVFDPALNAGDVKPAVSNTSLPLSKPIALGTDLVSSLQVIFDAADLTAKDVVASVFFRTFSPDTAFLMSTNPVYVEIEPAFISTFSATLLRPVHHRLVSTLQPGFCPYRTEPTVTERGQVADLFQSEARVYRDRARVLERVGRERNVAYSQVSTAPIAYTTARIDPSPTLYIALIMAFILASLFGVGGAIACLVTITGSASSIVDEEKQQKDVDKYVKYRTPKEDAGQGIKRSAVDTSRAALEDAEDDEISARDFWSIFDVWPTIVISTYRSFKDSVKEFSDELAALGGPRILLWTHFVAAYE
jgi:hypothetical protein